MKTCAGLREFLESIDIDRCSVNMPVDGLFLCGGPVGGSAGDRLSLRHSFLASPKVSSLRVALAEDVFRRLTPFSERHDLLAIERHIAYLTRTILLFSESPGSIAELGAFSVLKECSRKLCVVLDSRHAEPGSFIYDGPIAHMCRAVNDVPKDSDQVQVFDWPKVPRCQHEPSCGDTVFDLRSAGCQGHIDSLCEHLLKDLSLPPKPATHRIFATEDDEIPHLALLVIDLIRLARCTTRADIAWMLQTIGRPLTGTGSKADLDYLLTLIDVLGFVSVYPFGRQFYCARTDTPSISYAYKKGTAVCSFEPCMQMTWEHIQSSPLLSTNRKAYAQHCAASSQEVKA